VIAVNAGSNITLPNGNNLTRSGFTFGGWNTNASGTGLNYAAGSSFTPTGSITLFARWNSVSGGGNIEGNNAARTLIIQNMPESIYYNAYYYGGGVHICRAGTTLQQFWSMSNIIASANLRGNDITVTVTGNVDGRRNYTLHIPLYTVNSSIPWAGSGTFDIYVFFQGGDGKTHFVYRANSINISGNTTTMPFSRATEVFSPGGSGTGGGGSGGGGTSQTFTVSFNANGGSGTAPGAQTVNAGSSITLPSGNNLSRSGFTFGGWNTNAAGTGTNYAAGSSFTPTGNITLFASWNGSGGGGGNNAVPSWALGTWHSTLSNTWSMLIITSSQIIFGGLVQGSFLETWRADFTGVSGDIVSFGPYQIRMRSQNVIEFGIGGVWTASFSRQ
jgi:uncharacterized repeat protein (TIGR02543 family)